MKIFDNPATRLALILRRIRQLGAQSTARQGWTDTLKLDNSETLCIYAALLKLSALVEETESAVRKAVTDPTEAALLLRSFGQIKRALALPGIEVAWDTVVGLINETAIQSVEYCAIFVKNVLIDALIERDELDKLKAEVDSLFEEAKASALDEELRDAVIRLLEVIRRAVVEYEISGTRGIRNAVVRAFGELFLVVVRTQGKEPPRDPAWQRSVAFVLRLARIVTKTKPLLPLLKLLNLPESVSSAVDGAVDAIDSMVDTGP